MNTVAAAPAKTRLFTRDYVLVVLVNMCTSIGFYFFQPLLPRYITGIGISITIAGVISGMFSFTALAFRPFTGLIADRIQPKTILLVALPLEAISGAFYAIFPNVAWIVICRLVHATGFAFATTVLVVYGSFFIPKERMGEGIGYLGLGSVIGTAIGPTIGLGMANIFGYRLTFITGGVIMVIATVMIFLTRPPEASKKLPEVKSKVSLSKLISVKLIPLSFLNCLFSLTNGLMTSFISLQADAQGIKNINMFFVVLAFVMLVTRPSAGKLNDKMGLNVIALPCFVFNILGLIFIANAHSFAMMMVAGVFMALGQGTAMPAFQTACVRAVPDSERGVATSTYFIFSDVSNGTGAMLGGKVAEITSPSSDQITYTPMYTYAAYLMGIGMILYILYAIRQHKRGVRM